jgi:flagellar hook-associated protein 3 FlgL
MLYSSLINDMNRTLSDYTETNIQNSSQKRINKPSDDPVGAGRVVSSRATLSKINTYTDNVTTAKGWLSTADSVLGSGEGSVQNLLSDIRTRAMQAATSTVTAENRLQIGQQVRGLLSQLVALSNSDFSGSHIFAGHKTDQPAYVEGLGVSLHGVAPNPDGSGNDQAISEAYKNVDATAVNLGGGALPSHVVSFVPVQGGGNTAGTATYYWTDDAGKTWNPCGPPQPDSAPSPGCTISGGGVALHISDMDAQVTAYYNAPGGGEPELDDQSSLDNGSWFCVRPTAIYQGDDDDTKVTTTYTPPGGGAISSTAHGYFSRDVAVRLDPYLATDPAAPGFIRYSYSVDDGGTWIEATTPIPTTGDINLPVPGGYLTLDSAPNLGAPGAPGPDAGMQFVIHPHRADVNFQIGERSTITVNMVGKEVFGGLYNYPGDLIKDYAGGLYNDPGTGENVYNDRAIPVGSENPYYNDSVPNLFETVGELICALECNSQSCVQMSLDKLDAVMNHIMAKAAEIGGREDRLAATESALIMRQFSEEDNLSRIEDVDMTELLTKLAQQQTAYQAVLKSSSMIMQMGLVNFL